MWYASLVAYLHAKNDLPAGEYFFTNSYRKYVAVAIVSNEGIFSQCLKQPKVVVVCH